MTYHNGNTGGAASLPGFVLADVVLLSPPFGVLSYSLPEYLPQTAWSIGMRVAVPLGKSCRAAVITALRKEGEGDPPPPGLKPLLWPLERVALLSPEYIDIARQLGFRQAIPLGRILGTVLPSTLRTGKARIRFLGTGTGRDVPVSRMTDLDAETRASCAAAWMRGDAVCLGSVTDPLENELCILAQDPPWPVRPRAARQLEVLEYLYAHGAVSRRKVTNDLGAQGAAALALLAERDVVRITACEEPATAAVSFSSPLSSISWTAEFALTGEQKKALETFIRGLEAGKSETHLLHGVTGSGKSVVYMALAAECLARGKSVMLLAPEVALAHKLFVDAQNHLPDAPVFLYHGYQPVKMRDHTFRSVASGSPALIVGTRSALFLPAANLGAVILDEEHDGSFKQDEGLPYQAKEVAWYRAGRENALLVLGSATPDVKTYHAAKSGALPLHELPERVGGGTLPSVRLVTVPRGLSAGSVSVLAPESVTALAECVKRGDQAVILLNRRGYAPLMYCLSCGETLKCPQCSISLTYHKTREKAVCHYCGHSQPFPSPCPACGGMHFLPMGEGTEKLEESLAPMLVPGTRILRLDRDSTRRPGMVESILNAFARKEAQVLVGTQMLSKGHHFPDVTLVIAADADLGLNLPDYRAAERTFQLLVQASGRAGRGEKRGEVLIQTRDPGHYCWEYVKTGDYAGFYAREVALREKYKYPPFSRLALLRMSFSKDSPKGAVLMEEVAALLKAKAGETGVRIMGPAPAPLALLRNMRRYHCLIKADNWNAVRDLYSLALAKCGKSTLLRLALDLDPVNML
ncbi:MAG: primosomal protein N' [Desulfovibrio sp.]